MLVYDNKRKQSMQKKLIFKSDDQAHDSLNISRSLFAYGSRTDICIIAHQFLKKNKGTTFKIDL